MPSSNAARAGIRRKSRQVNRYVGSDSSRPVRFSTWRGDPSIERIEAVDRRDNPLQKCRRLADPWGRAHSPQDQWITLWEALRIGDFVRRTLTIRHLPKN